MCDRSPGLAAVFFLAVFQAACGGDAPPELPASYPFAPDAGPLSAFSDVFEVVDSLELEENDSVVVATPVVSFDGERFLMADVYSFQVREYAVDGSLLFAAGRRGRGPGEYLAPMRASRALDGGIRVIDGPAMRSTYYPPGAPRDPRTEALPFAAYKQIDLGVDRRLVAGTALSHTPGQPTPMLHIWNVRTGDIERSFLTDPFPKHLEPAAVSKRAVDVMVRQDTIWTVSALSDSIHAFGLDGSRIGAVPLPLVHFSDPGRFDLIWDITDLYLLGEDEILVELGYGDRTTGDHTKYLAIVDRQGNPRAMLSDTPPLYVVADDLLYFQNPGQLEPNRWIVARRKNQP